MKTEDLDNSIVPVIVFDKSLEQYKNRDMFPEKLAKAKEIIAKHGLPKDLPKYSKNEEVTEEKQF